MTTLIVGEKPSMTRKIAQYLPDTLDPSDTYVVHTWMTGPAKFKFVRGRALRDYPCIESPIFELDTSSKFTAKPLDAPGANGIPVPQLLPRVSRIVYACDPDATGIWAFRSALRLWSNGTLDHNGHDAWIFNSFSEAKMRAAMAQQTSISVLDAAYEYAQAKRYFEYQWLNNAHAILGHALQQVGVQLGIPSKWSLQVLYFVRDNPGMTSSILMQRMEAWMGTGRYPVGTLGSPASRPAMLEQLERLGLLCHAPTLSCTAVGHALLSALHPDCNDLDLPQRLDAWCRAGLLSSRPTMDRYIRTFFGKQARRG